MKTIYITTVLFLALLFGGCTIIDSEESLVPSNNTSRKDIHTKSYQLKITPIIGSRQDDEKVIMDMGKIMKIWISPYKNNGTFVSSHDNYVVAVKPDFVVGENIPQRNWQAVKTPTNTIPFLFRDSDMDTQDNLKKEDIVKYNNNIYKQQNDESVALEKIKKANKYDYEIKQFLNQK